MEDAGADHGVEPLARQRPVLERTNLDVRVRERRKIPLGMGGEVGAEFDRQQVDAVLSQRARTLVPSRRWDEAMTSSTTSGGYGSR
jgi:hypothetical protein